MAQRSSQTSGFGIWPTCNQVHWFPVQLSSPTQACVHRQAAYAESETLNANSAHHASNEAGPYIAQMSSKLTVDPPTTRPAWTRLGPARHCAGGGRCISDQRKRMEVGTKRALCALKNQCSVGSAKPKVVLQGILDRHVTRDIGAVVKIAVRVLIK